MPILKAIIVTLLFLSTSAFGQNVRCQKTGPSSMNVFFCPCPSRVVASFRTGADGEFAAGQKLPIRIDGVTVGRVTLKAVGERLIGRFSKGKTDAVAKRGSIAEIGGVSCKLR